MRLIDADAAADKIMRETEKRADDLNMIGIALMIGIARMLRDENDFPTVEAAPVRHGRWLPIEADGYADGAPVWDKWECSECGHEHDGEEALTGRQHDASGCILADMLGDFHDSFLFSYSDRKCITDVRKMAVIKLYIHNRAHDPD